MTLYSLSGHVTRPGQYEAPLGITLRELLDLAGGMREGHELKFWTPGGSSTPLLTAEHLDVPLDFEGVAGAGLDARHQGAADLRRDDLRGARGAALDRVLRARVVRQVHAVPRGHLLAGADPAPAGERARAPRRTSRSCSTSATTSSAASFCALGDGATSPITSSLQYFRDEYIAHFEQGGCPFDPAASTLFASAAAPAAGGSDPMTVTSDATAGAAVQKRDDLVALTIDGFEVRVPKGTLVIRAAELLGIQIPRFCDHPLLDPVGACRQCLVEVDGPAQAAGLLHHHGRPTAWS